MGAGSKNCRTTGKRRYRDHPEAVEALHRFQVSSTRDTIPVRSYLCTACGGWHITSQPVWGQNAETPTPGR